jgi:hypothetical protein
MAASSEHRHAITQALGRIEAALERDSEVGEDFYGDWIYQYGPLALVYSIYPKKHTIKVVQLMRVRETD